MDFKELIAARRSVRGYESAIPHDALTEILRQAQRAPSWKNQQTARCYAVETPEILEALRAAALPSFNQNSSSRAALIVTTYVKDVVGCVRPGPTRRLPGAGSQECRLRHPDHGHPGRGRDPVKAEHPSKRRDHVCHRDREAQRAAAGKAPQRPERSREVLLNILTIA